MNLDNVTDKHLHEIERLVGELLAVMRQAKLQTEPITESLNQMKSEVEVVRRARFDLADREYHGY